MCRMFGNEIQDIYFFIDHYLNYIMTIKQVKNIVVDRQQ